jgi:hypothetical protein
MQPSVGDTPWLLWPFVALWRLIAKLVELVGRLAAFAIGVALLIAGALLTITVIGAIVGVPLAAIGLLLIARSLF